MNTPTPIIITLDGNIGAGKSTLLEAIRVNLPNITVIQEPVGIRELGLYETIWSGSWEGFKQKIKKYEKNIKK